VIEEVGRRPVRRRLAYATPALPVGFEFTATGGFEGVAFALSESRAG
jgi:hypothetical protein